MSCKVSVVLIGGAFDPIHPGHFGMAKYLLDETGLFEEAWFVPCYRHLYGKSMAPAHLRLAMCKEYAREDKRMKVCDYEIVNELAGETYHFLNKFLSEDFVKNEFRFSYAIGLDNAYTFENWVNYDYLRDLISFIVLYRQGQKCIKGVDWFLKEPHKCFDAVKKIPEISSTQIREQLYKDREETLNKFYNKGIADIIKDNKLYIKEG